MAITFLHDKTLVGQRKFQQYLIIALVAVSLITAFVLWKGFSKNTVSVSTVLNPNALVSKRVEINFAVLQNKIFDELDALPPSIEVPKNIGRANPFMSF